MLNTIVNKLNRQEFRKSESKIAQVIIREPSTIVNMSIANLARLAEVSEPSVNRFCTALGCNGFPDFKIKLAQSLAQGVSYIGNDVQPGDSSTDIIKKIFDSSIASLQSARDALDEVAVENAISVLAQAKKIEFYGLGASGSVAMDAQHKFFRLNVPVIAHTDVLMQRMAAAVAGTGDAIVLISNTGKTRALLETIEIARESGALTVAITNPDSPLASQCDILLGVDTHEDTTYYTPATSRLAHLVIIDMLATGIALKRGPRFENHLKRVKQALVNTRTS